MKGSLKTFLTHHFNPPPSMQGAWGEDLWGMYVSWQKIINQKSQTHALSFPHTHFPFPHCNPRVSNKQYNHVAHTIISISDLDYSTIMINSQNRNITLLEQNWTILERALSAPTLNIWWEWSLVSGAINELKLLEKNLQMHCKTKNLRLTTWVKDLGLGWYMVLAMSSLSQTKKLITEGARTLVRTIRDIQNSKKHTIIRVDPVCSYPSRGIDCPLWRQVLEDETTTSSVTEYTTAVCTGSIGLW